MMQLMHEVPGRLRFTSAIPKGRRYAAALRRRVRSLGGVTQASLNPITGGLIVHYETTQGTREAILRDLEALVKEPIVPARSVSGRAKREHVKLAEIIADRLAEHLVEGAVRKVISALI
jgi:Heavy metal associated domain 2